jgi:hypothetical protein
LNLPVHFLELVWQLLVFHAPECTPTFKPEDFNPR